MHDPEILHPGIYLCGAFKCSEPQLIHDSLVHLLRAEAGAVKKTFVACACPHGALHALAADIKAFKLADAFIQVLDNKGQAVADSRDLGTLDMGESHAGKILVSHCLIGKCISEFFGSGNYQPDSFPEPYGISVVQHVHAGGAQVDYSASDLALLGIGLDLSHQVMMDCGLNLKSALNVYVLGMSLKISKLLI